MPSGLLVQVIPKEEFEKKFAILAVRFGSVDLEFIDRPSGKRISAPEGIAHFLEHCLFAEESGDVFHRFAALGGAANAATSFSTTTYHFSCSERFFENLETLLEFVSNPYFVSKNVEKEKEIIAQEIRMYRDNADWQAFRALLEGLFSRHPIRNDIAGTEETIRKIDAEWLHTCYRNFYHPANMKLFVSGDMDPKETFELVARHEFRNASGAVSTERRIFPDDRKLVGARTRREEMSVASHKVLIGFRDFDAPASGEEILRREAVTGLLLDSALGRSSRIYESLYEAGVADDSFSASYNADRGYGFTAMGGETDRPEEFVEAIKENLRRLLRAGVDGEDFERIRNKALGKFYRYFNAPESAASAAMHSEFRESDLFRFPGMLRSITIGEINSRAREHLDPRRSVVSIVAPRPAA